MLHNIPEIKLELLVRLKEPHISRQGNTRLALFGLRQPIQTLECQLVENRKVARISKAIPASDVFNASTVVMGMVPVEGSSHTIRRVGLIEKAPSNDK